MNIILSVYILVVGGFFVQFFPFLKPEKAKQLLTAITRCTWKHSSAICFYFLQLSSVLTQMADEGANDG